MSDSRTRERTPALILGNPHHNTLGVIRALAQSGVPHFTVGVGTSFVSYCRWHRRLLNDFENDPTPESLAGFLERLPVEQMVLIPCSDEWVAAVSGLEPALAERFPASIAPPEAIDICLDKGRFAETMIRLGLPHPRTILIGPSDDVRTLWDSGFRDPFLKPRNTHAFNRLYGTQALRAGTADEAMTLVRETRQAGVEFLLQEYIPGSVNAHCAVDGFIDRTGTVCARLARRRIRQSDEHFITGSCYLNIPLEEVKAQLDILDRLLPALRYRGVFCSEFKYDERDGVFKLLEVNPRVWGAVSLPVSFGVNVVEMAYQDALGLPVERVAEYPVGRYWINASYDRRVCRRLFWEGRLNLRTWLRTRFGAVQTIFRWDDPLPAIVNFAHRVACGIRRAVKGNAVIRRGATG